MKKILLVLVISVFSLSACGTKAESDGVLTIWAGDPNGNIPIMEHAAEIYNETNPDVKIDVVEQTEDITQQLHTSLASGTTEGLPDILLISDLEAQTFLQSYPDAFFALDDYINYDDFLEYKTTPCILEEKTYCVPLDVGVTGMFYRRDYFEEAGYTGDELNDITWKEYFEISDDVYQKTGHKAIAYDANGVKERIMLHSAGTWYTDDRYENLRDNPALVETLEYDKIIRSSEWAYNSPDWNSTLGSINNGELASFPMGAWIIGTIKAEPDQSGKWGVAKVPRMEVEDSVNYSDEGGSGIFVLNGTGDEELAADFLNVAYTDTRLYEEALTDQGQILSYIPAFESDTFDVKDDFFGGQQVYKDFAAWTQQVPPAYFGPETTAFEQSLAALTPDMLSGKLSVEETLDEIQKQIE